MARVGANSTRPDSVGGPARRTGERMNEEERVPNPPCCIKEYGSITVEAAFAVPFFMAALVALIFLLSAIHTQVKLQWALYHQIMKASGYSYYLDSADLDDQAAAFLGAEYVKLSVIEELGDSFFENSYIIGKQNGIFLNISDGLEEGMIDAALEYQLQPPYDLLGIGTLTLVSRARCREWNGLADEAQSAEATMAYVTADGSVYHRDRACKYINVVYSSCSFTQIQTMRNPDGKIYYPCEYCCEENRNYSTVYYMNYGTRYHANISCKNFHRNVYMIDLETAKERYPACSNCGGG